MNINGPSPVGQRVGLRSVIGDTMSATAPRPSSQTAAPSGPAKLLSHPVDTMTTAVEHVPGASVVKGVANGVLDTVGIVSPHARRVAAYAGVGLLGAAGIVEWPVAAAGAAVVWLTQQRPKEAEASAAGRKPGATRTDGTRASGAAAKKAKATSKASASGTSGRRTASSRTSPARTTNRTRTGRQA